MLHILCIWNCSRGTLDLNYLDSVAAELIIPAYFLLMVRTTTRKTGKPRFSLHIFKNLFLSCKKFYLLCG